GVGGRLARAVERARHDLELTRRLGSVAAADRGARLARGVLRVTQPDVGDRALPGDPDPRPEQQREHDARDGPRDTSARAPRGGSPCRHASILTYRTGSREG